MPRVEEEERELGCTDVCARNLGCAGDTSENLDGGVATRRACTDVPCCILLLGLIALIYYIIISPAIKEDHHERLFGAEDYLMQICGRDELVKDLPVGAWPKLSEPTFMRCVDHCDRTEQDFGYKSVQVGYWCIADSESDGFDIWTDSWSKQMPVRQVEDIYHERPVLLKSVIVTVGFMFIWILLLYCFWRVFMYFMAFSAVVTCMLGSWYFIDDAQWHQDKSDYFFGFGFAALGLFFIVLLYMFWDSFQTVLRTIEKTSSAIVANPQVLLIPFLTAPFVFAVFVVFLAVLMLMYGAGHYEELPIPSSVQDYIYEDNTDVVYYDFNGDLDLQKEVWYVLFWLYWSIQYIAYFNFMIISGTVAEWYLETTREDGGPEYSCFGGLCRCLGAFARTVRYHLGTIAFASLIISLIQIVETILAYVKKKLDEGNSCAKLVCCCTGCLNVTLECIVNKFNQGALVMVAVYGRPFCAGLWGLANTSITNLATVSAGLTIIGFLKLVGNITITILTTSFVAFYYYDLDDANLAQMGDRFVPLICVFLISYGVSHILLSVWSSAALTLLVCLSIVADEQDKGSQVRSISDPFYEFEKPPPERQPLMENAAKDDNMAV